MNAIDSCPLEMLGMNFEWIGMGISTINNLDIKAIAGRTYLHDPSWSINAGQRWTRRDRPDATVPVAKIWRDDDLASFTDLTSSWYGTMVKVCLASVRIVRQELGLCMGWQLQYLVIYWLAGTKRVRGLHAEKWFIPALDDLSDSDLASVITAQSAMF